jgi:hypothetical protein
VGAVRGRGLTRLGYLVMPWIASRLVEPSTSVNRNVTTPEGGPLRTPAQDVTPSPLPPSKPRLTFETLVCRLEFNQSAHHCRQMMMCWWRLGWVLVRLGLTSNSKR